MLAELRLVGGLIVLPDVRVEPFEIRVEDRLVVLYQLQEIVETHVLFSNVESELLEQKSRILPDQGGDVGPDDKLFPLMLDFCLGQNALERLLLPVSVPFALGSFAIHVVVINPFSLLELQQLIFSSLLINDIISTKMGLNGRPLHRANPLNIILILLIPLRLLFHHIHLPKSKLLRMEVEILLVVINRVQELLLGYHAV